MNDSNPVISPDGSRVAFISNRSISALQPSPGNPNGSTLRPNDIYIVNTDGTGQPTRVTQFQTSDNDTKAASDLYSVVWSPDGTRLAFRGARLNTINGVTASRFTLGAISPSGGGESVIDTFPTTGPSQALDWSPDGRYVGVVWGDAAQGAPGRRVVIYDLQTNGHADLCLGQALNLHAGPGEFRFSPDSQRFVVGRTTDFNFGTGALSFSKLDGSGRTDVSVTGWNPGDGIWWQGGAAIPTPFRLELIPDPAVIRAGGPSVQMYPTLYDAQNNVIVRAATAWRMDPNNCFGGSPAVTHTGLITPSSFTGSYSDQVCASNGGLNGCAATFVNPPANKIDEAEFFVRQHYADFLNRAPDAGGLAFWTGEITSCGANAVCVDVKRVNVSQAFFLSIEFQKTGYLVARFYKATFTDSALRPRGLPRVQEFLSDTQAVGAGVVVGQSGWEQKLEENRQAFARQWVQRPETLAQLPSTMTAAQFVDKLFQNSEVTPTQIERDAALAAFGAGGVDGRAAALRSVADSGSVYNRQYNAAFVLMQYIGYLRRNPNDAPDTDYTGYNFWLGKMNSVSLPGEDMLNDQQAQARALRGEMVRAFLVSQEYRRRFGP